MDRYTPLSTSAAGVPGRGDPGMSGMVGNSKAIAVYQMYSLVDPDEASPRIYVMYSLTHHENNIGWTLQRLPALVTRLHLQESSLLLSPLSFSLSLSFSSSKDP